MFCLGAYSVQEESVLLVDLGELYCDCVYRCGAILGPDVQQLCRDLVGGDIGFGGALGVEVWVFTGFHDGEFDEVGGAFVPIHVRDQSRRIEVARRFDRVAVYV